MSNRDIFSLSHFQNSFQKRERAIQQKLETQEESNVEVQGSYQSLHEEAAIKEKKLKKVTKTK